MNFLCLSLCLLIPLASGYRVQHQPVKNPFEWKIMEFDLPADAKQQAMAAGNFDPTKATLIDVQPHFGEKEARVFVTTPRFGSGIPFSLAEVTSRSGNNGLYLVPYPNYEMNDNKNGANCDAITSAFRLAIDDCNQRLWVIDSGSVGSQSQCPPQLLAFNLKNNELEYRHRFNASVYTPGASLLITPIVRVKDAPPHGKCEDIMVYIPDVNFHGLVVHDVKNNNSWRIEHRSMYPEPKYGLLSIANEKFVLMDGIFGLATDNKNLYYHALASKTEYKVPLAVIDNSSLFANGVENMDEAFQPLGKRNGACATSAMDSDCNLYCVTLDPIQLLRWNVHTNKYNNRNIESLPINKKELEFVSGMKVAKNYNGQKQLWMVSNRYQKMAAGTRNFNEINYRIVVYPLEEETDDY